MKRTRSAQSRRNQVARIFLSLAFAGSVTMSGIVAGACDRCGSSATCSQGCSEPACSAFEPTCGCGSAVCSGGCRKLNNPILKTLDAVAGGIERILGLDRCNPSACAVGCDSGCDDACDAAFASELMTPLPYSPPVALPYSPSIQPAPSLPTFPVVPPIVHDAPMVSQPPMAHDAPAMSQPRVVMPHATESYAPSLGDVMAPRAPTPMPTPAPAAPPERTIPSTPPSGSELPKAPKPEGGNIFDTLDDPFGDDEVRLRKPYRGVRPTSHESSARQRRSKTGYAPVYTSGQSVKTRQSRGQQAVKQRGSLQNSRRRVSSASVQPASHTAGLRPLVDAAPKLRPVGRQNFRPAPTAQRPTIGGPPPPMASGRVLAPYRRSNR